MSLHWTPMCRIRIGDVLAYFQREETSEAACLVLVVFATQYTGDISKSKEEIDKLDDRILPFALTQIREDVDIWGKGLISSLRFLRSSSCNNHKNVAFTILCKIDELSRGLAFITNAAPNEDYSYLEKFYDYFLVAKDHIQYLWLGMESFRKYVISPPLSTWWWAFSKEILDYPPCVPGIVGRLHFARCLLDSPDNDNEFVIHQAMDESWIGKSSRMHMLECPTCNSYIGRLLDERFAETPEQEEKTKEKK